MARSIDAMRSVMLGVFKQEGLSSPGFSVNLLEQFIEESTELQLFCSEKHGDIASWVGLINSCLNSTKTRLEGISLLRVLFKQCPSDVFQQHYTSWIRLLTQILQSHDHPAIVSLASIALRDVLKDATQDPELSREVSTSYIGPLISAALEMKSQYFNSSVEILTACVTYFPRPCGTFRSRSENLLVQLMNSDENGGLAMSASRCLALLPRVGGGGQGGIKHTDAWTYYCSKVLASIDLVLVQLYGLPETDEDSNIISLSMTDAPLNQPMRTHTLVRQFQVLCVCLQHMLRSEFPVIVKLPINRVLSLCQRILELNGKMLSMKVSVQWTLLAGALSKIHCQAFHLLAALMSSCRGNLIPHGHMINKLFVQALGWTMSSQSEDVKLRPYGCLRVTVYSTLQIWLETVGACSGVESTTEKLVEQILHDAETVTPKTKLKINLDKLAESPSKSSGKSKQKGYATAAEGAANLARQQRTDPLANSQVCLASLNVLKCLLMHAGTKVKPDFHKDVHEFVIPLLLCLQQLPPDQMPAPYISSDCRKALYHVLLACVVSPHPRWPAPLQCAGNLFSQGCQDTNITVSSFCTEASVICQTIIHPRVPCLQQPISIAELKPKSALSLNHNLWVGREHDNTELTDINGDVSSPVKHAAENMLDVGNQRAPSVEERMDSGTMEMTQANGVTVSEGVPSQQEKEDSAEDTDEEEITDNDQEIGDKRIKMSDQETKEVDLDDSKESLLGKMKEKSDETESPMSSQPRPPDVPDAVVSSTDVGNDQSLPSPKNECHTPLRRSKRQKARRHEEAGQTEDASGDSKYEATPKRLRKDEKELIEKTHDYEDQKEMEDETAMMLSAFVDSFPDQD